MNRRDFIKTSGAATVCLCGIGAMSGGCSAMAGVSDMTELTSDQFATEGNQVRINPDSFPPLTESGGAVKFEVPQAGDDPVKVVLINSGEGEFKAFDNRCTHGKKELNYNSGEKKLICSSFGHSQFALDGSVIKGPAKEPIKEFTVRKEDKQIVIALV